MKKVYLVTENTDPIEGKGWQAPKFITSTRVQAEKYMNERPGPGGKNTKWTMTPTGGNFGPWAYREIFLIEPGDDLAAVQKAEAVASALSKLSAADRSLLGLDDAKVLTLLSHGFKATNGWGGGWGSGGGWSGGGGSWGGGGGFSGGGGSFGGGASAAFVECKLNETNICGFDEPWIGTCKAPFPCLKHSNLKCHCGKPATTSCSFAGMLVCGAPLCAECKCKCSH